MEKGDDVLAKDVWFFQVNEFDLLALLNASVFVFDTVLFNVVVVQERTTYVNRTPLLINVFGM